MRHRYALLSALILATVVAIISMAAIMWKGDSAIAVTPPIELGKLTAPDGAAGDWFGNQVSVSGNTLVVGAPGDNDNGENSGAVYVFARSGQEWLYSAKLTAPDGAAGDSFGFSVSVSDGTIVVGAYLEDGRGENSGAAYVFAQSGRQWLYSAKLTAPDGAADDSFGFSVSVSGGIIVVGAYLDDGRGENFGAAHVFARSGEEWAYSAKLTAPDGAADDRFGRSVSVSGGTIAVGAYRDDDGIWPDTGSAYVFIRPSSGWTSTSRAAKLTASDAAAYDEFGWSVSVSGDTIAIGTGFSISSLLIPGSAYVFTKPLDGWVNTSETAKLTAPDGAGNDQFGWSVSVSGDTVVVGAPGHQEGTGSAYVFTKLSSGWIFTSHEAKLTAPDGAAVDNFGRSVSVSDGAIVVGAQGDDDLGENSGAVYWSEKVHTSDLQADLELKLFSGAMQDRLLFYFITVVNKGPSDALEVALTNSLPSGVAHLITLTSPSHGSCSGITVITCDLGRVDNGNRAAVMIVATAGTESAPAGDLINTASVTSVVADPDSSNNTVSLTTDLTPTPTPTPAPTSDTDETTLPLNDDRVVLNGGTLNGQQIDRTNPSLSVAAGQGITGTVNLSVTNGHGDHATFPVGATSTWGDHQAGYWEMPISPPPFGTGRYDTAINLTAPSTPGAYAIVFAAQAETSIEHVMSATHWPSGQPHWNNGDDIAGWDESQIDFAIANGYVRAPQYGWGQPTAHFGAAAIKIVVNPGSGTSTPAPKSVTAPTAPTASHPINVLEISPQEYHQGEEGHISFHLRNDGSVQYRDIEVIVTGVKNSRDEAFYDDSGDSNNITLGPGDDGWVSESLRTYGSQRLGGYTISYYIRYRSADGNQHSSPTYSYTLRAVEANEDIAVIEATPQEYHQGEEGHISFRLRNNGTVEYAGVEVIVTGVRNSRDEAFYDEGGDSNNITLASGDDGWVSESLRTYGSQRLGDYTLTYYLRFHAEGRTYLTPTYSLSITAVEANEDVAVIEATPQEYHQGEEGPISFRLRNNGSVEYTGIEIIVTGVRNSRDEAFYDEGGDSNNITLASGDDGWVSESLRTYGSQRLGDYTLTCYLRFHAEGRTYLTPTYSLNITAVEANEDVAVIEATPQEYHQGEEGPISFRLRNNGSVEYAGIEVIVTGVRNSRDEAFYDESGGSNNITLAPGDNGWVSEPLRTYGSQRLGDYTLTYYLRFRAEGRIYLTPTYSLNIEVTPAPP